MAQIGTVKDTGSQVEVYDERGSYMFSKSGSLVGYTATTVSVRTSSGRIEVYNERGSYQYSK